MASVISVCFIHPLNENTDFPNPKTVPTETHLDTRKTQPTFW